MSWVVKLSLLVGLVIVLAWGEKAVMAPGILSVASIAELEKARGNPSVDRKRSAPIHLVREYGAEHRLEKLTDIG